MSKLSWSAGAALAGCIGLIGACAPEDQGPVAMTDQMIEPAAAPAGHVVSQAADSLFPPSPEPGHCYARVLLPAAYETSEQKVLVQAAEQTIVVDGARYEWVEEPVLVKEASIRLETVPAVYASVTEQVLVKPEGREPVAVPAKYQTTTERILDKPAHTVWKRAAGPIDNAIRTTYDESTGEVMCLVEVPATYRTIQKRTLVAPAATTEVVTPAEYKTVTKKVLKAPPHTREVRIPAEYKTVKVQKLIEPARERRVDVPAEYETVTRRTKVSDEMLVWREVLCDVNLTADVVRAIQERLAGSGHYGAKIDGLFGPQTLRAVNAYARTKGLPAGSNYIAVETAEALGVRS